MQYFSNLKVSQDEWGKVLLFAEKLLYVGVAAVLDYLVNQWSHGTVPFSPLIWGILSPVLYALKLFFDGKVS